MSIEETDDGSADGLGVPAVGNSEISESEAPLRGSYKPPKKRRRWPKGTHDQVTRQIIAFAVLGVLAVLYVVSTTAFVMGGLNGNEFTMAIAAISGPQALAAAVIGFYYGKKSTD